MEGDGSHQKQELPDGKGQSLEQSEKTQRSCLKERFEYGSGGVFNPSAIKIIKPIYDSLKEITINQCGLEMDHKIERDGFDNYHLNNMIYGTDRMEKKM